MYVLAPIPIRFFVSVPAGTPVWFLVAVFVNDSLKGLLAASLLRRKPDEAPWFHSVRGFFTYLLVAVALAPALSGVLGAATRMAFGGSFWLAWKQWFLGDALANLSLTPALCCLFMDLPSVIRAPKARGIEFLLIALGLIAGASIAFSNGIADLSQLQWILYLLIPFVFWVAIRFGPLGTSIVLTSISVVAMFGALFRQGIFSTPAGESAVLSIQHFLLVPSIPFLLIAVLITAIRTAGEELRTQPQKLVEAQETERQRIGQELHDDLGQRMVCLTLGIEHLANLTKGNEDIASHCANLRQQALEIMNGIRGLSHQLRPLTLE
jgi:integral membrane sensor domain MASE1